MQDGEKEAKTASSGTGFLTGEANAAAKLAIVRHGLSEVGRILAQSLDPAGDAKLALELKSVELGQAGDVLSAHSESIATAAIRAEQWGLSLLAGVDASFVHALVDVLFGGSGATAPLRPDRSLTRIELEVVKVAFRRMALALEGGFAEIGPSSFILEHTDSPPSYDSIGRPSTATAVGTFDLASAAGCGRIFIAVPQSAFVFLRNVPARRTSHSQVAADPQWRELLGHRLYGANVSLTAVLGSREMTLGEVADFRPGQIIEMEPVSGHRVSLDCNGQRLYWCKLAQADGAYCLTVEEAANREQELTDDILSH